MRNFFDDIMQEFPDHEFKADRGLFRIDKEVAGWYFPLSKAVMLKSMPFPNVTLIIFDEFIIGTGAYRIPAKRGSHIPRVLLNDLKRQRRSSVISE